MPWHIEENNPKCKEGQWAVVKDTTGQVISCHESKNSAEAQITALNIAEANK